MIELWDLYDANKKITGKIMERGMDIPKGYYHLVVHVWIKNKDNLFLISRRSSDRKSYPLLWECPGGSVLAGEISLEGALREIKEEVGINLSKTNGKIIYSKRRDYFQDFMDVWLFEYNGKIDLSKATTNEVCEVKWMNYDEIKELFHKGELVPTLDYFFELEGGNNEL